MSIVDDLAMCCHRTGGQLAAVAQGGTVACTLVARSPAPVTLFWRILAA